MTGDRKVIAAITLTLDGHTTGPGGPYDMRCIAPHGVSDQARAALVDMTSTPIALLGRRTTRGSLVGGHELLTIPGPILAIARSLVG
jgi:hypothetical protein